MTSVSDCLFCQMSSGAFPTDMLHQDSQLFAIRDINPRAPIHLLIIPRRHYATVRELELEHAPLLSHMVTVANSLADQLEIGFRGYRLTFNVGDEGGQTIYHLHMHLLGGHPLGPDA
jgi:histidine triad (HIT) family protein